jgi:hypothetical protein
MRAHISLIAVLFLATGTAHAYDFQCGEIRVTVERVTSDHLAEVSFTGFFKDLLVKKGFKFQFTEDYMGAKLNGKTCKVIEDEDAKLYRERVKACHDRGEPVCADDN